MKQIFAQHVDKKEISSFILKSSFRVYIDQFDPERTYLIDQDVRPFLQIDEGEMARIVDQYKHDEFLEYQNLNDVIQKAILRARQIRVSLEKNNATQLFQLSKAYSADGYEEWKDPDLNQSFPKNDKELTEKIKHQIVQFIASESKRYGDNFVDNRKEQTLRIFDKQRRDHENQYLFINSNNQPMDAAEKENVFTMHVLKALANSLDAHTTVLNPAEAYDMRTRLEKEIQGIGVVLQPTNDGGFVISQLVEGGPAAKSGLVKINDHLVKINEITISNMPISKVMELIRGKNGSKITLMLERKKNDTVEYIDVNLNRAEISINEDRVESAYETFGNGIIGKIKLDSFYQSENGVTSENDVRDAIKKLDKQGNLRGLILDFRENSGGFLSQAVKVAGLFITNGVVVISKYFNGEEHVYRDMDGKISYDGPLIILTSKATASAAEIVAQALQDYGVAIIVGDEHTYGKGTIQSQTVTENKATTFFKVTVGKYYTVSGKTPQIQGVKADVVVPSQFVHENIGEEYLDYALKADTISPEYDDKLEDINSELKPWYMRYYIPSLQHKKKLWTSLLPMLRKNSAYRIEHNKNYQMFLKGKISKETLSETDNEQENFGADDLQMAEAVSIMKDMIVLHSEMRGSDLSEDNTSSSRAGIETRTAP